MNNKNAARWIALIESLYLIDSKDPNMLANAPNIPIKRYIEEKSPTIEKALNVGDNIIQHNKSLIKNMENVKTDEIIYNILHNVVEY